MSFGRKMFTSFTLLFVALLFTTTSFAQETVEKDTTRVESPKKEGRHYRKRGRKGFRGGRHGGGMFKGLSKLDLTVSQKSQIQTLKDNHKNSLIGSKDEVRTLRGKMRDGSATEADIARMRELRSQYRETSDQLKNSILGVLTEAQRLQLQTMREERRQRMGERRQQRMERKQQIEQPVETDG